MLETILILGDVHRPFHDKKAWELVLRVGKALKPDHLWLIGDYVDFYAVSAHSKDPRRRFDLEEELVDANRGLDELDALGAGDKVFLGGNHEDRLRRYLQDKAPELFGTVSVPKLLGLSERGWHYVGYRDHIKRGKLHLTHDVGSAGRYAAFKALDTYQHSVITGHTHRLCYLVEGNAVGEQKLSVSFGWLGDVKAIDYMQRGQALKNWALGFGVGLLDSSSGLVYLTPVPIITKPSYSCVVNGKLYR